VRDARRALRNVPARVAASLLALGLLHSVLARASVTRSIARLDIRGRAQTLQIYGMPSPDIALLSSGDGGWVHLAPHVAEVLAARGWYVVGFDAKSYLEGFTGGGKALSELDVQSDYARLIDFITPRDRDRPVLIGVSEGSERTNVQRGQRHRPPGAGAAGRDPLDTRRVRAAVGDQPRHGPGRRTEEAVDDRGRRSPLQRQRRRIRSSSVRSADVGVGARARTVAVIDAAPPVGGPKGRPYTANTMVKRVGPPGGPSSA